MSENRALVQKWFDEVWNNKNRAFIREMTTEETVHHGLNGPGGPDVKGIDAFEEYYDLFTAAFDELRIEMLDLVAEGDKVAARFRVTAKHKGHLPDLISAVTMGEQGFVEGTGKTVEVEGGGICRFENGKFAEVWNYVDFMKMFYDLSDKTPDVA